MVGALIGPTSLIAGIASWFNWTLVYDRLLQIFPSSATCCLTVIPALVLRWSDIGLSCLFSLYDPFYVFKEAIAALIVP